MEGADDNQKKQIVLDASPNGLALHNTLGFEEIDKLEIQLECRGEGLHIHGTVIEYSEHMGTLSDASLVYDQ
jgi:hypothetical protein